MGRVGLGAGEHRLIDANWYGYFRRVHRMESGRPPQGGQTRDSATLAAGGVAVAGDQVPAKTVPLPRPGDKPGLASKSRLRRLLRGVAIVTAVILGGLVLGLLAGLLSGIL